MSPCTIVSEALVAAESIRSRVKLTANFRSVPPLIDWFNDRFARVLGLPPNGRPFDPTTGRVFQQPLAAGREGNAIPPVHILPFEFSDGEDHRVDEYRELEGRVLARYLRWLVEASDVRIVDPLDGRPRAVRYSDVAILAVSTWRLSLLFPGWLRRAFHTPLAGGPCSWRIRFTGSSCSGLGQSLTATMASRRRRCCGHRSSPWILPIF